MIKQLCTNESIKRATSGSILLGCMALSYLHSIPMFAFFLCIILLIILFFEWPALMPLPTGKFFLASLIYPIMPFFLLMHLTYRFYYDSIWLPLYPFVIAWSADTFGYLVGKNWGRHKMCPTLSPGKSWEGFAGSFFGVMIANLLVIPKITAAPFNHFNNLWAIMGTQNGWLLFGALSLLQTTLAFLGGAFISKLKRLSGQKDSGIILPGHGGFLDRFDSVLATVILIWFIAMAASI